MVQFNPYAANLIGNLTHWLNDDAEISDILGGLNQIDRFDIVGKS